MDTLLIKPGIDSKGSATILSRLSISRDVDLLVGKQDNLYTTLEKELKKRKNLHCILVDESQFLTKDQVTQLFQFAVMINIPVICYGLRTDFLLNGFEGSKQLLLLAHSIEELKTICRCGRKALANTRKVNGKYVFKGDQVAIEGEENVEYESLCAQCYYKYSGEDTGA